MPSNEARNCTDKYSVELSSTVFIPIAGHRGIPLSDGDDGRGYLCSIIQDLSDLHYSFVKGVTVIELTDQDFEAVDQIPLLDFKNIETTNSRKQKRVMHLRLWEEEQIFHKVLKHNYLGHELHKQIRNTRGMDLGKCPLYFITGVLVLHNCDIGHCARPDCEATEKQSDVVSSYNASVHQKDNKSIHKELSMDSGETQGTRIVGIQCRELLKNWGTRLPIGFHGTELGNPLIVEHMFKLPAEKPKSVESKEEETKKL